MQVFLNSKLRTKLTLSHLLVTLACVTLLALLVLGGYYVYLQTDRPAAWVGDWVFDTADELAYLTESAGGTLDEAMAIRFVSEYFDTILPPDEDEFEFNPDWADWFMITDPQGHILASNYPEVYPAGTQIQHSPPPGFNADWLNQADTQYRFDEAEKWIHYVFQDTHAVGQAAIIDIDDQMLGWVYLRANDQAVASRMGETAAALGGGLLGAAVIATLVSGLMGRVLARSFSRRLEQMNSASAAFAGGNLSQRVAVEGEDEIAQLGKQFNAMADQLSAQLHELRQLAEQNAQLAQLEERNRLARELHDAVKQQLFGLSLTAGAISPLIEKDPKSAARRIEELSRLAQQILEEMDHIIKQLRPASLADRGLAEALGELTAQWSEQTGVPIKFSTEGARELPMAVEQALYRIAQEALNNIARHAKAQQVTLTLNYDLNAITLCIADDGCGFDPDRAQPTRSLGLTSMRERAAEVNGQLDVDSDLSRGTTITAHVPDVALEVSHA